MSQFLTQAKILLPCPIEQQGNGAVPAPLGRSEDCVLPTAQTPGPGENVGSGDPCCSALAPQSRHV